MRLPSAAAAELAVFYAIRPSFGCEFWMFGDYWVQDTNHDLAKNATDCAFVCSDLLRCAGGDHMMYRLIESSECLKCGIKCLGCSVSIFDHCSRPRRLTDSSSPARTRTRRIVALAMRRVAGSRPVQRKS